MKTLRLFGMLLLAISLCLSACSEIENPIEPTPDPKPEEVKSEITIDADIITNGLSFTSDKGEKSISFTTNEDWTLSIAATPSGDAWCSASTTSGAKGNANVKFSVTENTSYDDRSVSVTIKSGTASKTFTITQKYAEALLLTTNKYELSQDGGTIEIEVKANIDYEMEIAESAKDWITEAKTRALTTYKHTLTIATNEEVEKREGEIYFKSGEKVETVKIYQEGAGAIIVLSQKEYVVSDAGETISVDIKSNIEYDVQMPDVDWISVETPTRGMSSHSLQYNISPNEEYDNRSAEIIFYDKNSDLKETLKVTQAQKDVIIISSNEYNLSCDAQNVEVKLQTNVDFDIHIPDAAKDWVSHMSTRALVDKTLVLEIKANEGYDARSCEVILKIKNNILADTIKIHQAQKDTLFLNVDAIEVKSKGETISCELNSNIEYICKINEGEDWIKRISTRGLTEFKETFEILSNQAFSPRTGSIIFRNNEKNIADTLFINQHQVDTVFVDTKDIRVTWKGGEYEVTVCSNVQYDLKLPEWVTEKGKTTSNENELLITTYRFEITENLDIDKDDNIIFIWNNEGTETETKIHISQECCTIELKCAGTLKDELTSNQIAKVKYLVIKGDLNGTDALFFRRMTNLVHIDLEYANIVSGGESYYSNLTTENGLFPDYLFYKHGTLESVILPRSIHTIGSEAFQLCTRLNKVKMFNNVRKIKYAAFEHCSQLKEISLSKELEEIIQYAFNCCSLKSIIIPSKVKIIQNHVFDYCNLSEVHILSQPSTLTEIWTDAFSGSYETATLYIPKGTKEAYYLTDLGRFQNIIEE